MARVAMAAKNTATRKNPPAQAATIAAMVTAGLLNASPTCPGGGSYTYNATTGVVACSVAGHAR